jgi:hypothetical protein
MIVPPVVRALAMTLLGFLGLMAVKESSPPAAFVRADLAAPPALLAALGRATPSFQSYLFAGIRG